MYNHHNFCRKHYRSIWQVYNSLPKRFVLEFKVMDTWTKIIGMYCKIHVVLRKNHLLFVSKTKTEQ